MKAKLSSSEYFFGINNLREILNIEPHIFNIRFNDFFNNSIFDCQGIDIQLQHDGQLFVGQDFIKNFCEYLGDECDINNPVIQRLISRA